MLKIKYLQRLWRCFFFSGDLLLAKVAFCDLLKRNVVLGEFMRNLSLVVGVKWR